jgi:hypothetical protein
MYDGNQFKHWESKKMTKNIKNYFSTAFILYLGNQSDYHNITMFVYKLVFIYVICYYLLRNISFFTWNFIVCSKTTTAFDKKFLY